MQKAHLHNKWAWSTLFQLTLYIQRSFVRHVCCIRLVRCSKCIIIVFIVLDIKFMAIDTDCTWFIKVSFYYAVRVCQIFYNVYCLRICTIH